MWQVPCNVWASEKSSPDKSRAERWEVLIKERINFIFQAFLLGNTLRFIEGRAERILWVLLLGFFALCMEKQRCRNQKYILIVQATFFPHSHSDPSSTLEFTQWINESLKAKKTFSSFIYLWFYHCFLNIYYLSGTFLALSIPLSKKRRQESLPPWSIHSTVRSDTNVHIYAHT